MKKYLKNSYNSQHIFIDIKEIKKFISSQNRVSIFISVCAIFISLVMAGIMIYQAKIDRDTLILSMRPYLKINNIYCDSFAGTKNKKYYNIGLEMENYGKTNAFINKIEYKFIIPDTSKSFRSFEWILNNNFEVIEIDTNNYNLETFKDIPNLNNKNWIIDSTYIFKVNSFFEPTIASKFINPFAWIIQNINLFGPNYIHTESKFIIAGNFIYKTRIPVYFNDIKNYNPIKKIDIIINIDYYDIFKNAHNEQIHYDFYVVDNFFEISKSSNDKKTIF